MRPPSIALRPRGSRRQPLPALELRPSLLLVAPQMQQARHFRRAVRRWRWCCLLPTSPTS